MEHALNTLAEVQHQMARLMERDRTGITGASSKFRVMEATEDIEDYLLLFEHYMVLNEIPKEEWTQRLVPVLTGRASRVKLR